MLDIIYLALGAVALALLAWFFSALLDQATTRGAYQVWLDNQTFAAALIALLAAAAAARPVYMQVRAQSVTAALDLLHRLEAESQANVDAHTKLYDLRRAVVALSGEINAYAQDLDMVGLKSTITSLLSFNAREFRILASQQVIDQFLDEESQSLAMLSDFIGKPVSLLVENVYNQEQFDIILV